jgi:DNA invertase Pin-like site-specific DNA recombinase
MSDLCGYVRGSTDRATESGCGFGVQESAIERWAQANGHSMVLWCRDDEVSGADHMEARRGLPEALAAIQSGMAAGLVVNRLDRLAGDLVLQELLRAEIIRMGGRLFTTSSAEAHLLEEHRADRPRMFVRRVIGTMDGYEHSMIGLRRSYGLVDRHHPGSRHGSPSPVGVPDARSTAAQSPAEQEILYRVSELHELCRSMREIATALANERIEPELPENRPVPTLRLVANRQEAS